MMDGGPAQAEIGSARADGAPSATHGEAAAGSPLPTMPEADSVTIVPQAVARMAAARPEAVALRAGGSLMTYGELDARANRLARHLRAAGVGAEVPVGICIERSFGQIVAALAVLKAGGAYLPLDPSWPEERRRTLLDDARAPVLITGGTGTAYAAASGDGAADGRIEVALERDAALLAGLEAGEPATAVAADQLAYIIYTSGSTGEPKGVEVTHANLANLVDWHRETFAVTADDRATCLAGLGFDAAVWEIWPYLAAGASIALVDETVRTSSDLLRAWLVDERITVAFVPTALAEPMLAADWPSTTALRFLLTGADTLHAYPREGLPFALVNNYGPTECTVVATSAAVAPNGEVGILPPIGRPILNTQVHLVDEAGELVPPGETGEILIGGAGVARGYRHRPELTASRFVADRFGPGPGTRLYRTGDLGRLLPDGQIAFHGRIDQQEKIRGHRVEPDAVASALNLHPQVVSSAVVGQGASPAERRLVAYVVAAEGGEPGAQGLRDFLGSSLPEYMIPATFVRLTALPLTSSGKLDRRALPEPGPDNELGGDGYRAPETATEERLVGIISELLGSRRIGADDNFFLIGGHSLLGTQVVLRAREAFGVKLTLRHLFEAQTVARLAGTIEELLVEQLESMSEEEALQMMAG